MARVIVDLDLDGEAEAYIDRCARIRKISRTRLLQRLMGVICADQLVLSVLDDDSQAQPKLAGEKSTSRVHRRASA